MKKILFVCTFALVLLLLNKTLKADESPSVKWEKALTQMLDQIDEANAAEPDSESSSDSEGWYFKRGWLRLRFKGGYTAAGSLTVALLPEIDALLERPFPAGVVAYKPKSE